MNFNFKNFVKSIFTYTPEKKYDFNLSEDPTVDNQNTNTENAENTSDDTKIFQSVSVNLDYMKTKYNTLINSDVVLREFTLNAKGKQYNAFIVYIDGMVNSQLLDDFILEPLMMRNKNNLYDDSQNKVISEAVTNNITVRKVKKFDLVSYVMNCLMPQNTVKTSDKFSNIISGINSRKLRLIY